MECAVCDLCGTKNRYDRRIVNVAQHEIIYLSNCYYYLCSDVIAR